MTATETLGDRIRRLRTSRGLTQQDLATGGIHSSYISLIEAGKRQPTPRTLEAIAQRLETTVEYLRTGVAEDIRREAEMQLGTARLLLEDGRSTDAVEAFRSLTASADEAVATKARWGVATALEASGDLEHAIVEYEQLRELQANGDQHRSSLAAATALCRCYREVGDLAHAIAVGDGAVAQLRRYGLSGSDAHINLLLTIAMAYLERGDLTKTRQLLVEVQQYVDALGTPRARGAAYWNAAVLAGELGDTAESVQFIERATALFGEGDDERNLARLRGTYATLLMRHDPNRATDAALTLQRAREKLERIGSQVDVAYCETELSRAYTLTHRIDEAVTTARAALSRLDHGMRLESARARTALAYALAASGDAMAARTEYLSAATTLEAMGARRQATLVWLELAEMERVQGDVDQALNAMSRAISTAAFRVPFPAPVRVAPKAPATGDRG